MMERELRDELEVPGHVIAIETITRNEARKELNAIMDEWEKNGWNKPNDVPESSKKQRYRKLLRSLGLKVDF